MLLNDTITVIMLIILYAIMLRIHAHSFIWTDFYCHLECGSMPRGSCFYWWPISALLVPFHTGVPGSNVHRKVSICEGYAECSWQLVCSTRSRRCMQSIQAVYLGGQLDHSCTMWVHVAFLRVLTFWSDYICGRTFFDGLPPFADIILESWYRRQSPIISSFHEATWNQQSCQHHIKPSDFQHVQTQLHSWKQSIQR